MWPILFVIPGSDFKIHSYGVMVLIACFSSLAIGVGCATREHQHKRGLRAGNVAFLGGRVGARGMYVLSHLHTIHNWATRCGAGKEATFFMDVSWVGSPAPSSIGIDGRFRSG